MLIASLLILFGVFAERWLVQALGLLPRGRIAWPASPADLARARARCARRHHPGRGYSLPLGPNRPLRWRSVWPGAVLATVLWLGATTLFAWYARHIANYNVVYGGVAAVILLLVWMYVLAVIALIGCEFNAQCEKPPATRTAS